MIARWLPVGADSTRIEPGRAAGLARLPDRDVEARVGQSVGQLAPDRHLDPDQVDAGRDQVGRLLESGLDLGLAQGDPEPRPIGLAEHPDGLAPDRPLGVDPLDRGAGETLRLGLGDDTPVVLAEQLAFEGEVDRPGRDVHRELVRLEVVLEERHRERQGDPVAERARVAGQPPVDRGARQRASGGIESVHAEQAQDRPLLADRRRGPGAGAPGTGERVGARDQAIERPVGRHAARRREGVAGTWTSIRRPAGPLPQAVCAQYGPAARARDDASGPLRHRSTALASRLPARKPRYASAGSSDAKRTPRSPNRSAPGTIAAWSASTPRL